jgi:hypothetical protein
MAAVPVAAMAAGLRPHCKRQGQQPRAAMGFNRKALEVDRRERQGLWNRSALPRQGSASRGTGRRPGICLSPRQRKDARGRSQDQQRHWSEGQEARRREGPEGQPAGCAERSQQDEAGRDRKNGQGRENRQNCETRESQDHVAGASTHFPRQSQDGCNSPGLRSHQERIHHTLCSRPRRNGRQPVFRTALASMA